MDHQCSLLLVREDSLIFCRGERSQLRTQSHKLNIYSLTARRQHIVRSNTFKLCHHMNPSPHEKSTKRRFFSPPERTTIQYMQSHYLMEESLRRIIMEDLSGEQHRHADSKKPNLGFPLGTAFVLLIVLGISALFSICYHWEKIRSFHGRHASFSFSTTTAQQDQPDLPLQIDADLGSSSKNLEIQQQLQSLPVLMPGDEMPKFIAWPSPYVSSDMFQTNDSQT